MLFETEFENVNYSGGKQYPSIDLRDKHRSEQNHKSISIQVTSDESLRKVTDCLETFIKHHYDRDYDVLYIVMLVRKQNSYSKDAIDRARKGFPFDSKEHILDLSDLYKKLNERNDLNEIRTVLGYLESQFADLPPYDQYWKYRSDLNDYDRSITKQYEYVDISGYSPKINNLQVKVGLKDLYVNQALSIKEKDKTFEVPVSRLLVKGGKSVILGDPGSGKSTLLKWLMYDICSHREYYPATIPVYVRCAVYAQKYLRDQIDLGAFILQTLNMKNRHVYEESLVDGQLVLLLDGLDEISDVSLRHDIVESINTFIAQNSECRVIATSRKIGYSETRLDAHFTHYELLPFNIVQIHQFARNWFKAVDEEAYSEDNVRQFVDRLHDNRSVFRLASTPLLLMIICLIQYQGLSLPENRIDLYSIATNTLLDNWVKKRTRYGKTTLTVRQLIGYLSPVAFYMQENCDEGLIKENDFKDQLFKVCREKTYGRDDLQIEREVDDIISYVKEDAGFLQEIGTDGLGVGQFSFMHLTFQEYFSAIRFVTKWEKGLSTEELREYVLAPYWNEVLVLAAEELFQSASDPELGCERVSRFVDAIFNIEDSIPDRNRPLRLIICILGSGASIHLDLLKQIVDRVFEDGQYVDYYLDTVDQGAENELFVDKLISEFHNDPKHSEIARTLMRFSSNPTIYKALEEILEAENNTEKEALFEYNVVYPIAPIVRSSAFKNAIVSFVNNADTKKVPIQYTLCLIQDEEVIDVAENTIEATGTAENVIEAIKAIKRTDLQKKYAEHVHFLVWWKNRAELTRFSTYLKDQFPEIDSSSLDEYIDEMTSRDNLASSIIDSIKLIDSINGLDFYYNRKTKTLAILKNSSAYFVSEPYDIEKRQDLEPVIEELRTLEHIDVYDFSDFIRRMTSFIDQGMVAFMDTHDFELYITYREYLAWDARRILDDINNVIDYFFDNIGVSEENIRKYKTAFSNEHTNPRSRLYDMTRRTAELDFIIHSKLSAEEKADILVCMEISRKYRRELHDIVNEAISDRKAQGKRLPYSVKILMNRI